jgi:hypothetical protein
MHWFLGIRNYFSWSFLQANYEIVPSDITRKARSEFVPAYHLILSFPIIPGSLISAVENIHFLFISFVGEDYKMFYSSSLMS